jgi:hypothetical protein
VALGRISAAIQLNGASDYRGIAIEAPPPETVAHHCDGIPLRHAILIGAENPAELSANS